MEDIINHFGIGTARDSGMIEVVVRDITLVAEGVAALTLQDPTGLPLPLWTPGAHIDVTLPGGLVRQYSLCGKPEDQASWRIAVLRQPEGRGGSEQVHQLAAGDRLTVSAPRNNFALVDAGRYLFIAGGIGITPILPMLHQVAASGKPWTLLYGGRTRASMAYLDEIALLDPDAAQIVPQDEFGLLDLPRYLDAPCNQTAIYCCGPAPLIDAVEAKCQHWPKGALHRERFEAREKPALPEGAFEVELARSGQRLVVPPHTSLLQVLEEAGHKITNSCRAGICGTCLVKVLAGTPQHNDDVLSDAEREAGQSMLVCVSRAQSGRLVLDI
ncbi:PDR/VanB family oxidoreductase [Paracoccus sulfuroxidans]|uniref:Ferredoxin-NADP reductase n=1 Tax=Paracoccus sulfuroxidans TaxID=384678 RepID=A0A562NGH6_9RHOB|nr:PDR/VanB family oxidoreductase [Paracoccus sulfuroxidans]TWI31236.1 ferredoxin-NADP reductase [Paracoccus sulfuroxidans]